MHRLPVFPASLPAVGGPSNSHGRTPECDDSPVMNPTVLFHTEGFHARDHLAALVERKAQKLFRHQAAIVRLRIRVVRDTPHGRDENFAATGKVERAGVDFAAHAQATEPEAAIIELMQNLERQLTEHAGATQSARRTLPVEGENPALAEP